MSKRGARLDCPLTEAVQNVPAFSSYTLTEYRDEQASRLYQHACKLERLMQAAVAYFEQTQSIHGDDACDKRTTEKFMLALSRVNED